MIKVKVKTPEKSEAVQRHAFCIGYKWFTGGNKIQYTAERFLLFNSNLITRFVEFDDFNNHPATRMKPREFFNHWPDIKFKVRDIDQFVRLQKAFFWNGIWCDWPDLGSKEMVFKPYIYLIRKRLRYAHAPIASSESSATEVNPETFIANSTNGDTTL